MEDERPFTFVGIAAVVGAVVAAIVFFGSRYLGLGAEAGSPICVFAQDVIYQRAAVSLNVNGQLAQYQKALQAQFDAAKTAGATPADLQQRSDQLNQQLASARNEATRRVNQAMIPIIRAEEQKAHCGSLFARSAFIDPINSTDITQAVLATLDNTITQTDLSKPAQ